MSKVQLQGIICGLDPGASGAITFIDLDDNTLEIIDIPSVTIEVNKKKRKHVDVPALADILKSREIRLISTEKVHSMPGLASTAVFSFGRYYGQIEMAAAVLEIPVIETDPARWKSKMGITSDKDLSRERARALIPCATPKLTRKKDHDRAESILLALFGMFNIGLTPGNLKLKG